MSNLEQGANVRVVTPDRPDHEFGYVAQVTDSRGDRDPWEVWVTHTCDCWETGQASNHTRGYTRREVVAT